MESLPPSHEPNSMQTQSEFGRRLVLVVDDDIELRTSIRDFLVQSGFAVLEARNSYDALFLIAQYGARIKLLITEINLLPVGGVKLAENALRLHSNMQVLCMSLPFDGAGIRHWMRYLGAEYLPKPFTPFDLHEKVFTLLAEEQLDAPFPIGSRDIAESTLAMHSTNQGDPMFWMKEF